jgi:hypothetical protein
LNMNNRFRNYIVAFLLLNVLVTFSQTYCVGEAEKITWHFFKNNNSATFEEMLVNPNFPNSPDEVKKVFSTKAPGFYDNYLSGRLQGFIKVPTTTTARFNITSENKGRFYLSTDQNPQNKVLLAYNDVNTAEFEHNKDSLTQNSAFVVLQANVYYYFDVQYVAGGWSDQANLYWKTGLVDTAKWNIITSAYLYDIGCTSACLPAGTACNDNNAATTNDVQDGNCNCFGKPATTNNCIGDRGKLENYTYNGILGGSITDLTMSPKFPTMATTSRLLPYITMPPTNRDSLGHYLQGYITVPVSGLYKFNITGDDQTSFSLSSDDSPANKNWRQISVTGWTDIAEHNKYATQTTGTVQLNAGSYYYFEILNKEGWGGDHYSLHWQTPFTPANVWKKIPAVYTYDYKCELARLTPGTPCDDGNIFTNNDVINQGFNCAGTPCSGPDCNSPLASYKPYDKCNVSEQIDNNQSNNWVSCTKSPNPNPVRSSSHWLRYDLGKRHKLLTSHIWNYNMPSQTGLGFGMTAIDYSLDGVNWVNLDTFNLSPATGGSGYGGQAGPDIDGIYARYVMFTSLDGGTGCRGLSKVAFQAVVCPQHNTPCNDNNRMTLNDRYDTNCNCVGMEIQQNPCVIQNLNLGDSSLSSLVFGAIENVQSISTIPSNDIVSFVAGKSITLQPGFETLPSALFVATIDDCVMQTGPSIQEVARIASKQKNREKVRISKLEIEDLNNEGDKNIKFFLDKPGIVKLELLDITGTFLYDIIETEYINDGYFEKQLRMQGVSGNDFIIRYTTPSGETIQKEF